jgi:hypothetical protein
MDASTAAGTRPRTVVPAPGAEMTSRPPPSAESRSAHPLKPNAVTVALLIESGSVVGDLERELLPFGGDAYLGSGRAREDEQHHADEGRR